MRFGLIIMLAVSVCCQCFAQKITKKSIKLATGIDLKYMEIGSDNGEVVIMLHGYTDTGRSFFDTMHELNRLDPSLKIYVLDQRGHGESSMPPASECADDPKKCFSMQNFAADVIAFMDSKGIDKAHVVGHSMGSMVAQELAIEFPDRLHGMVLIGSWVNSDKNDLMQFLIESVIEGQWKTALTKTPGFQWPADAYVLRPVDLAGDLVGWIKTDWVADPLADSQLLSQIYPETMGTQLGTWIGVITGLANINNIERLKTLSVNTLVLWATQDNAFPQEDQQELTSAFNAARLTNNISFEFKVYGKKPLPASGIQEDDFGHNLQWAAFEGVAKDILSFVRTGKPTADLSYYDAARKAIVTERTANQQRAGSH